LRRASGRAYTRRGVRDLRGGVSPRQTKGRGNRPGLSRSSAGAEAAGPCRLRVRPDRGRGQRTRQHLRRTASAQLIRAPGERLFE
jgi:hypothetical protein